MRQPFDHERSYRGDALIMRLRSARITICGAGAVGANLTETLARQGAGQLRVVDRDRIEAANVGTQPWSLDHVGAFKAEMLASQLYDAVRVEVDGRVAELTPGTAARHLRGSELVVDALDNHAGRAALQSVAASLGIPCLHVGLAADYCEVVWDPAYRVPPDAARDVCDYPLARNLVGFAVALAAETVLAWLTDGTQESRTLTLLDAAVRAY